MCKVIHKFPLFCQVSNVDTKCPPIFAAVAVLRHPYTKDDKCGNTVAPLMELKRVGDL